MRGKGRTVLVVGLQGLKAALSDLPVRVLYAETGRGAIEVLKDGPVDAVICFWGLKDMPAELLVQRLRAARPGVRMAAVVRPGAHGQEKAARGCGVDAVLPEDGGGAYVGQVLLQLLGITEVARSGPGVMLGSAGQN